MLESSLPDWIIQKAHVETFTEFPNAKGGLMATVCLKEMFVP